MLFGGGFQREVKARAVLLARETGGIEKLFGVSGIVSILRDVWFVGPVIGREKAAGDAGFVREEDSG